MHGDDCYHIQHNPDYPDLLPSVWVPAPDYPACFTNITTKGSYEALFLSDLMDFRFDIYFQYISEDELYASTNADEVDARGRRRLNENYLQMEIDGYEVLISKDCFGACIDKYKTGPKIVGMSAEVSTNTMTVGMPLQCRFASHNACLPQCEKYGECEFEDRFVKADWWVS